jgi:hypothetical protein
MDVETSDQHTVKPWFDDRVNVAPPVIDLTAQSFMLLGGRLDYVAGEPVASIVYQRRKHVINLFVAQRLAANAINETYNVRHWSQEGLDFCKRSRRDVHGVLEELCANGLTTFGSAMHNFWNCPSKKANPQETSDTRATLDTDNISTNGNNPQDRGVRSTLKTNSGESHERWQQNRRV